MERAISEMEKIKRAEEIYSRRNNLKDKTEIQEKNKSIYKNLFQLLIVVNVAIAIVAFQNKDYIFTKEFIGKVNSLNINVKEKIEEWFTYKEDSNVKENNKEENTNTQDNADKNITEQSSKDAKQGMTGDVSTGTSSTDGIVNDDTNSQTNINTQSKDVQDDNIENKAVLVENETPKSLSQEEKDIQTLKSNYSIILPLNGTKTSSFGQRESENSKVTKNHTGVDIAANTGTKIKSAISGKVTEVSEEGDYGKHLRITTDKLTILYAHCSKIYVSEGDEITQGQDVAEVGSTGNSTGPHLHFEIRFEDRFVNPELILEI